MDSINEPLGDFFEHDPSKAEKAEMRKDSKSPSEWLKLLCRDWAAENLEIAEGTDLKFLGYKSYLKGKLSSQLICRLSIPELGKHGDDNTTSVGFWKILGIHDEFDIRHIISQIEKFCSLYSIRSTIAEDEIFDDTLDDHPTVTVTGFPVSPLDNFFTGGIDPSLVPRRDQRRLPTSTKSTVNGKRLLDKSTSCVSREEKRQKKMFQRHQREKMAKEQKQAALKRAAELVRSNRIPIEITRGASLPKAVKQVVYPKDNDDDDLKKGKRRSDIVVSTASDLDQIVTHAKNLWLKYNAIAKEHNQKISWAMISKELGLHVKVREKYARMHSRALKRGFNFKECGNFKIKDHPEIFLEPIPKKQRPIHTVDSDIATIQLNNIESALPNSLLTNPPINNPPIHESDNNPLLHHDVPTHNHSHSSYIQAIHNGTGISHPTNIIGHLHQHHNVHQDETPVHHHQHPTTNTTVGHMSIYSTRGPDVGVVPQITDDQVAAAVDAAIKTSVPSNHSTDFGVATEEAQAAEVALAAGPTHLDSVDSTRTQV